MNEEEKRVQELLKAKLKEKGLPEGLASILKITESQQIEGAVESLILLKGNQNLPKNLDEFLNSNKDFQSEFDKRIAKALETREDNLRVKIKEELDRSAGGNANQNQDSKDSDVKKLEEQISTIAKSVESLTNLYTTSQKTTDAQTKFRDAKLPESWFSRIDVHSETSVENQIGGLKEEYDTIRQAAINEAVVAGDMPPVSSKSITDGNIEEYINTKNAESAENAAQTEGLIRM